MPSNQPRRGTTASLLRARQTSLGDSPRPTILDVPRRPLRRAAAALAPITKQSKTSCSRTRHSCYFGLRDLGQSFKHSGDRRHHPRCRSFQIVTAQRKKIQNGSRHQSRPQETIAGAFPGFDPGARSNAANTSGVGAGTWGLTRTAKIFGNRIAGPSLSPIPSTIRAWGERQTRTSAPVAQADARTRGSSSGNPASLASNRKAAAASADPPPSPAAAGNCLISRKRPSLSPGMCATSERAARSTRFSSTGPASLARGPRTSRHQIVTGLKREPVA